MEVVVTRSVEYGDELEHHGTKGMKWGRRLYQNPDGSLTELGKKRYNKQVEKLKAEEAKVEEAEKAAKTKQQTQAKLDKLDAKKQELEDRKKALKGKPEKESKVKPEETLEEKRERLLKSTDPKELYEGKDALTYQELSDRINRIDLENRLMSKIPVETHKTGKEYMDNAAKNIDSATNLYRSVDNAFGAIKNSHIGRTLANTLGIELPKDEKEFNLKEFYKNIDKKSHAEVQAVSQRVQNQKQIEDALNREAKKEKQAKDTPDDADNKNPNTTNNTKGGKDSDNKSDKNQNTSAPKDDRGDKSKQDKQPNPESKQSEKKSDPEPKTEPKAEKVQTDGEVYGKGTSKSKIKEQMDNNKSYRDTDEVIDVNPTVRKEVNEVVKKSGSTKLSDADYKQYQKDLKAWREKYDSENSSYSQKQMLEALYEIEDEYGLSLRKL